VGVDGLFGCFSRDEDIPQIRENMRQYLQYLEAYNPRLRTSETLPIRIIVSATTFLPKQHTYCRVHEGNLSKLHLGIHCLAEFSSTKLSIALF
jgi:hypothetical protein